MDSPRTPLRKAVDEQSIDKELTGYGIEVQGMNYDEKKDLLLVFKNSETTALAEANSRESVRQSFANTSSCQNDNENKGISKCDGPEVPINENFSTAETECKTPTKHPSITDNVLNTPSSSNIVESAVVKEVPQSKPKFTPKVSRLSLKSNFVREENYEVEDQTVQLTNSAIKTKSPSPILDHSRENDLHEENSICKKSGLSLHKKEDRKRNIDVFNTVQDHREQPFFVSKQRKIVGKSPYYAVPHGMNLKDFTVYFNQQLNSIAKSLSATQRDSLKLVPWGNPVIAGSIENKKSNKQQEEDQDECDKVTGVLDNQRYNFRGRNIKRKCEDDIFSYKIDDESSSDEDILFSKNVSQNVHIDRGNPYSGVSKRKPINRPVDHQKKGFDESSDNEDIVNELTCNDVNIPKDVDREGEKLKLSSSKFKIKNVCNSGIIKKQDCIEQPPNMEECLPFTDKQNNKADENLVKNVVTPNNRLQKAYKRKKVSKPLKLPFKSSHDEEDMIDKDFEGGPKPLQSLWLNTSINKQTEANIIKPLSVPTKMRKLRNLNLSKTKKKAVTTPEDEIAKVIDGSDSEGSEVSLEVIADSTVCPICKCTFPISDIQLHASDCVGYQDSEIVSTDYQPTKTCPICVERFNDGPEFVKHAKNCQVRKRLVLPPQSRFGTSGLTQSKR